MAKIPANILKMALDAIDEPVAAVGRAVSDMPETAARALDDMAGAADDWGWKGGKPGEITGTEWKQALDDYNAGRISEEEYDQLLGTIGQQFDRAASRGKPIGMDWQKNVNEAIDILGESPVDARTGAAEKLMENFYILERAGVPRSMTGKLAPNLDNTFLADSTYEYMLRNPIKMRKRNELSLDDYATAFRAVYTDRLKPAAGLTDSQIETYLSLLPQWEGSFDDLAAASRGLA